MYGYGLRLFFNPWIWKAVSAIGLVITLQMAWSQWKTDLVNIQNVHEIQRAHEDAIILKNRELKAQKQAYEQMILDNEIKDEAIQRLQKNLEVEMQEETDIADCLDIDVGRLLQ